ncbi:histidine phosphatase family protein [Kineococcus glutinatus]|uniref:Phosphoglycerate mutase n=1 Tax=Kineococcus glutinatus TaxID=1070872 RepID=A0ABP8VI24_9ACTN
MSATRTGPAAAGPPGGYAVRGATTVLLVRHGATAHTAERRLSGCTGADPELSVTGRRQAELLAAALRERGGVDVLLTSPVRRARQTAEAVAGALGLPLGVEDDLREIDFGSWEGLTEAEVERGWPGALPAWRQDAAAVAPGGESVLQVAARVAGVRERLLAAHEGATIAVVSHMYPVKLWITDALQVPPQVVQRMHVDPTGVAEIATTPPGDPRGPWLLLRHNDTGHLRA